MPLTARFASRRSLSLVVFAAFLACSCAVREEAPRRVEGGVLDLRDADLAETAVPLDGEWRFVWREYLPPEAEDWERPGVVMAEIPGTWNDIRTDGVPLPDTGYCSMQIGILLPPQYGEMGIKVNNVGTAYRLYVDGNLVAENGTAGTGRDDSEGNYRPRAVYFEPKKQEIVLTMHIANFHDRVGGVWTRMYLGSAEGISKKHYADGSIDMLLFGMFFIISVYYLISWFFGGRKQAFFWFGLSALMIAVRTLSAGEIYLMSMFPRLGFELNHKIQLSSQPALAAFFLLSLKNLFPAEFSTPVVRAFAGIMGLYGAVIWTVPLIVHSYLLFPFHIIVAILGVYIAYAVFRAGRDERTGAKILFVGFLVLFATTINDILYSVSIIHTGYVVTLGIIVFSISYIITLTIHKADYGPVPAMLDDACIPGILKDRGVSNRETEVVLNLLRGKTYDNIADDLFISKSTVTKHIHSVYQKLGLKNRVGLYDYVKRIHLNREN